MNHRTLANKAVRFSHELAEDKARKIKLIKIKLFKKRFSTQKSLKHLLSYQTLLFSNHSLKDFYLGSEKYYMGGKEKIVLSHNMYFQIFQSSSVIGF